MSDPGRLQSGLEPTVEPTGFKPVGGSVFQPWKSALNNPGSAGRAVSLSEPGPLTRPPGTLSRGERGMMGEGGFQGGSLLI